MAGKSDRVSIVLLTFNRVDDLRKSLQYLTHFGLQYPLYILDGSNEQNKAVNQATVQGFNDPDIHYLGYPEKLHMGVRIYEGLKHVKTKYTVIWADDDVLVPSTLEPCADFLEKNPDYSACIGKTLCLMKLRKPFRFWPTKSYSVLDHLRIPLNILDEEAVSRYIIYFTCMCLGTGPLFYTVRRTTDQLATFSYATPEMFYTSLELLVTSQTLARGKIKEIPHFMGFRNYGNMSTLESQRESFASKNPFGDKDLPVVKKAFVDFVAKNEGVKPELVDYGFDIFWNNPFDPDKRSFARGTPIEQSIPHAKLMLRLQFFLNLICPWIIGKIYRFDVKYLTQAAKLKF